MRFPFPPPTVKPLYVIAMGWYRWGYEARRRWVINLLNTSLEQAQLCREWLAQNPREDRRA